jgi:hypothetical protein
LLDLITNVRSRIDEPVEDYFLNREIISWLNEGLADMSLELRIETIFETTPVGSFTSVDLPVDLVGVRSVFVDGKTFTLGSLEERTRKSVGFCYIWGNRLQFPISQTGKVEIFYLRDPKPVVNMTDIVDIPDRYAHLLVIYAFSKAKEKDEEISIAVAIMQEYQVKKYEMVNELKQKQLLDGTSFVEPYGYGGFN